jgi:hypothetical protein
MPERKSTRLGQKVRKHLRMVHSPGAWNTRSRGMIYHVVKLARGRGRLDRRLLGATIHTTDRPIRMTRAGVGALLDRCQALLRRIDEVVDPRPTNMHALAREVYGMTTSPRLAAELRSAFEQSRAKVLA